MKISDHLTLFFMRIKRVKREYRNAEKFRRKGIKIGNNTSIFSNVHIDVSKGVDISIGNNCCLTSCSILGHDASLNKSGFQSRFKQVKIGNNVFVGWNSIVLMGVEVGDNVIIGAGSVVTKNIPSNSIVAGNPAKVIDNINTLKEKCLKA